MGRIFPGIVAVLMVLETPVHASGGSEALIVSPSLAVQGSVASFKLSAVVSQVVFELMDRKDDRTENSDFRHIESIADRGSEFVISSVRYAGDSAMVSFRALLDGTTQEVVKLTADVPREAFDSALAQSGSASTALANGAGVPVVPVPLKAGSAERLIGYSIALASDPSVAVCVLLNELGKQLYVAET